METRPTCGVVTLAMILGVGVHWGRSCSECCMAQVKLGSLRPDFWLTWVTQLPPPSFILQASSFTTENLHLPHLLMGQQTDEL